MILDLNRLPIKVDIEDVASLSDDDYTLARRNGLGASDASVYLGLMSQFGKDTLSLIKEKCSDTISDEERAIGQKENVRKGKDLEPLILKKAQDQLGIEVIKPTSMYRHKEFEFLTVNFDGVCKPREDYIPVEAKFVSHAGEKYYNRADPNGIPDYYTAQLQQQMLCLNSPYGYLAALFDKGWIFHMFQIDRQNRIINRIIVEGFSVWEKIQAKLHP